MNKKDLIQFCKYYKGDDKSPFKETDARFTAWRIESLWVDAMLSNSEQLNRSLNEYLMHGLKDFCKTDDIPISLKAFLMNRYFQYAEREDVNEFKKFYNQLYK